MKRHIDLNADLGEGEAFDAEIMAYISSCNIACGGHAGDAETMAATLDLAKAACIRPGAHPSYPDISNFGRAHMDISTDELGASLTDQISQLAAIANAKGLYLTHVKPHGALYNEAAQDEALAHMIAVCTAALGPKTQLVGPPHSALEAAAAAAGLRFIGEGFCDRAYQPDGQLLPRSQPGALLETQAERIRQAIDIAERSEVMANSGEILSMPAETICLHGDSSGALETARAVHDALTRASIQICPPE